MAQQKRQIFRKESLEKLSSPERLDQLLRVVRPQGWITLLSLGFGLGLAIVWSILGHVPVTASGRAILVHPKQVVPFQSPSSGHLDRLEVAVGDQVVKGQVLGYLLLPELDKELEEEREKLDQFSQRSVRLTQMEAEQAEEELVYVGQKIGLLERRMESLELQAENRRSQSLTWIGSQKTNLRESRELSEQLGTELKARLDSKIELLENRRIDADQVVDARARVIDNKRALAELRVKEEELALREMLAQQTFEDQLDVVSDFEIQISDLRLRETAIRHRIEESKLDLTYEQKQIESNIDLLETRYETERRIKSPYTGTVLEITTAEGEEVAIGHRLGKIEMSLADAELMALAFFPVKDGKKIEAGDKIRVSPATVQRERYGGIIGRVDSVSPYPITVEAAANQIGDVEIARSLLSGEARIQVVAHLEPDADSFTKFAWTSGDGPEDVQVTAGTTADVRVTIEERAPITLILPFLKDLSGS